MSCVWFVSIALFIFASYCLGDKHSLLPTTIESKHNKNDKKDISEIIRESRIGMPTIFPNSYTECGDGYWDTIGWDGKIVKIMADKMGITKCEFAPMYDWFDMDIQMYGTTFPSYKFTEMQYLYPHYKTDFCVLVQRMKPKSYSLIDIITLSGTMNIILMVYLVLLTLMLHLHGLRSAALRVLETFITGGFPTDQQPPVRNGLLISLSVTSLIILSALGGIYTSKLTVQKDVRQIQTLEEVNEMVSDFYIEIYLANELRDLNYNKDDAVNKLLEKKITFPSLLNATLKIFVNVTKTRGIATIANDMLFSYANLMDLNLLDDHGRSLLHVVPECIPSSSYRSFVVERGWPLAEKFNEMLMRLVDGGILNHLMKETPYDWWRIGILKKLEPLSKAPAISTEPRALAFKDIYEQLVILIAGLTLATAVFIAEVLSQKCKTLGINSKQRKIRKTMFVRSRTRFT